MKTIWPELIIFSVDRTDRSEKHNEKSRIETEKVLGKKILSKGTGEYAGSSEVSYLVSASDERTIKGLCGVYSQDCYLFLHGDRAAELRHVEGDNVRLQELPGRFQRTTPQLAMEQSGYSLFEGKFYTVR